MQPPLELPADILAAVARGWSVIPCGPDKRPLIRSWKPYQETPAALQQLETWQRDLQPPAWAVITGAVSGLVILDYDGDAGKETAGRLAARPHVATPSGGYHQYFRHPGHPVKTLNSKSARALGEKYPGLDIRADGGYALFAGATARGAYQWQRPAEPDELTAIPPDVRGFLGLDSPAEPAGRPNLPAAGRTLRPNLERWIQKAVEAARAGRGRNNAGFELAQQLRDDGVPEAEARAAMHAYAARVPATNAKGQPEPYTTAEAEASLAAAYRTPARPPARAPEKVRMHNQHAPQNQADAPPPPEKRSFPNTDLGNAERLMHRYGRDLRYCHAWDAWLVWDGRKWAKDTSGAIQRRAVATVRTIYGEAADAVDDKSRMELSKWAIKSEAAGAINSMIALARHLPQVSIEPAALDRDPWLFNCANGTLDLRTGQLRTPDRRDLLTKETAHPFDPGAECPTWERFVSQILLDRPDMIEFVRRAAGYSLSGSVAEKCLFVLHGGGDNGKTTFLEVLRAIAGEYAGQILVETLMVSRGPDRGPAPDIADLRGRRFVSTSEVEDGYRLSEAKVKYLTGMGTVKTRRLYEDTWEFDPTHKIWLDTNHLPQIRGTDKAIWDRIKRIPFELCLSDAEKDRSLKEKLLAEAAGILAWCVRGCLDWQRTGLQPPEEVRDATASYRAEMDILGRFLEEACTVGPPSLTTPARTLYRAYKEWSDAAGEFTLSERIFGQRMSERGMVRHRTAAGQEYRGVSPQRTPSDPDSRPSSVGMYSHSPLLDKSVAGTAHKETLPENSSTDPTSLHTAPADRGKSPNPGGKITL